MKRHPTQRGLQYGVKSRLALVTLVVLVAFLTLSIQSAQQKSEGSGEFKFNKSAHLERSCVPPTPEERARRWDYIHGTEALNNVSDSVVTQTLFNQGLLWRFGFVANSSYEAFTAGLEIDPQCSMCYWGEAYSYAPSLDLVALPDGHPFPGDIPYPHFSTAMNDAARDALAAAESVPARSLRESQYIHAMWLRFQAEGQVQKQQQFWYEFLYGARMISLWREDFSDLIAGALAAEAFMNTMHWGFYSVDGATFPSISSHITWRDIIETVFPTQSAADFTAKTDLPVDDQILTGLVLTLQSEARKINDPHLKELSQVVQYMLLWILQNDASMPMANHLHIHLTEAASAANPQVATQDAEMLMDTAYSWQAGHLAHMPSHNYYRVGNFSGGVVANIRAHELDLETDRACMPSYVPEHNLRVLVACASLGALLTPAEEYATVIRSLRDVFRYHLWIAEGYDYVTLLKVWGQFGQWDKIMAEPSPGKGARGAEAFQGFLYSQAVYHSLRYLAMTHLYPHDRLQAQLEYEAFLQAFDEIVDISTLHPEVNGGRLGAGYKQLAHVALNYMDARDATLNGEFGTAIERLQEGVHVIESMHYMEPPWAQQPPRQCLGYLYLMSGQMEMAQEVYLRDLHDNPKNPWSTLGCEQAGCPQDSFMSLDFQESQETAKYKITSSCPMLELSTQ